MKRRIFLILALCLVLPLMALLSSCGETPANLTGIEVEYKDNTYALSTQMPLEITYSDELSLFVKNDFVVTANYDDGSSSTITDFNYSLIKIGDGQDTPATDLMPGSYRITISYEGETANIEFSIRPIELSENNVTKQMVTSTPYVVNGKAEPDVSLVYSAGSRDIALIEGTDYDLTYGVNNYVGQNAGSVTVTFKGKYSGEIIYYFDITPLQIGEVTFNNVETTYDGTDKKALCTIDFTNPPIVGVTDIQYKYFQGANLDEEMSGEVKDAGSYKVVAHLVVADGYAQPNDMEFTLTIAQQDISNMSLSSLGLVDLQVGYQNAEYSEFDFADDVQNALANFNITYNLSASTGDNIDNLNASTDTKHGQFVITGIGNYKGQINVPFTITPASFSVNGMMSFNMSSNVYTYNGSAQTLREVHYYWNQWVELTEDDYDVDYNDSNIEVGICTFTVTGKGNYTGSQQGTFVIDKADYDIESVSWSTAYLTYNAKDQIDSVYITDLDEVLQATYEVYQQDIENGGYKSAILKNAGYYKVEASISFSLESTDANGYSYSRNYSLRVATSLEYWVQINQALATARLNGSSSFTYTGSLITPDRENVVVTAVLDNEPVTLTENVDYTLSFPNNSINVYDANNNYAFYYVNVYDRERNFFFDLGGARNDYALITYNITPKELWFTGASAPASINYPAVYKNIWNEEKHLDSSNAYVTDNALNISIIDEMEFRVVTDGNDTYISIEAKPYSNYTISENVTNEEATVSTRNPFFSRFRLNGVDLTAEEIDNQSTAGFILGDSLQMILNEGYIMEMGGMVNGGTVTYSREYRSTQNAPIIYVSMGRYPQSGTHTAVSTMHYFKIREDIGDFPTTRPVIAETQADIDVDVFETFTVGGIDWVNHSDWRNFFNLSSLVQDDLLDISVRENLAERVKFKISLQLNKYTEMPLTEGARSFRYVIGSHFESKIIFYIGGSYNAIKKEYTLNTSNLTPTSLDSSNGKTVAQLAKDDNYFSFTTPSSESNSLTYVLLSNNSNVDYAIMKSASDAYFGRCGFKAVFDSTLYYYVLPRLTPSTEYTLLVHALDADKAQTTYLELMPYMEEVDFEIMDNNYEELEMPRVTSLNKEAGEEVFVPQEVYVYDSDSLFDSPHFTIKEISSYAFCDSHNENDYASTMQEINLPHTIAYIGQHAFDGCSALDAIYYDGTGSDWEKIEIGTDAFANCSAYLRLVCLDDTYYVSSDGSIVSLAKLSEEQGSLMTLSLNPSIALVFGTDNKVSSVQALNDEGYFVKGSVDFVGKSPDEAIKAFIDFADEQGYFAQSNLLEVNWTLTTWFENTLGSVSSYLKSKNLPEDLEFNPISKHDLVQMAQQSNEKLTEEDILAMPLEDIFQSVLSYKTSVANFENEGLKSIFNIVSKYAPIIAKYSKIKDILNELGEDAAITMIDSLSDAYDNLKTSYIDSFLKTSSPLMLMTSTYAGYKMYLLNLLEENNNPEMISFIQSYYLPMLQLSLEMFGFYTSMMTSPLDTIIEQIDELLENINLSNYKSQIESAMQIAKDNISTDFMTEFGKYNTNVWTGSNINKEGVVSYIYHDGDDYTYTINKLDSQDIYVCYLYEGNLSNFDDATPVMFYQCEVNETSESILILRGQNLFLSKNADVLEEKYVGDETIKYISTDNYEEEDVSVLATTVFADSGLVYMIIGSYTKEQLQGNHSLYPITVASWQEVNDKIYINGSEAYQVTYDESDTLHENPILTYIKHESGETNEIYFAGEAQSISLQEGTNNIHFYIDNEESYNLSFSKEIDALSIALYKEEEDITYLGNLELLVVDDSFVCELGTLTVGAYHFVIEISSGSGIDDVEIEIVSAE